jgi:IS5 family transposase
MPKKRAPKPKYQTRRERFLSEMEQVVPWQALLEALEPSYYPNAGGRRGRPPIGLERMLRMYFVQQWYGLADEATEEALYDSRALSAFVGLDPMCESVPEATTLLKFRRWLEEHELTHTIFKTINARLSEKGLLMRQATLVDATIMAAPSSTKNKQKARDPEMHSTRKGHQWYFGLKAPIGVDGESGLVHSLTATAANTADITETSKLLHGEESYVIADAGYIGAQKREELAERKVTWYIAAKRSTVEAITNEALKERVKRGERLTASIRARVEHPFHIVKNLFRYRKVRYKGLAKNRAQLHTLFALANLVRAKSALLAA